MRERRDNGGSRANNRFWADFLDKVAWRLLRHGLTEAAHFVGVAAASIRENMKGNGAL
jgi:hypothetical protein